ncbi:hypothetical protein PFLUV_G00147700 [Perca fluviatilis]|uniref:Uncharacterized protein n=1 Tax=Perca fluviatilis TaxID=8168 RepID=A0A6A5F3D9_PERFL|nr:hypothetical protein PFLUV_G00147700 [Perca fluviatilis]
MTLAEKECPVGPVESYFDKGQGLKNPQSSRLDQEGEVISNSWLCNGLSGTSRSPGACVPLSCVRALFPLLYS